MRYFFHHGLLWLRIQRFHGWNLLDPIYIGASTISTNIGTTSGFAHTWLKGKDAQAALTELEDSQSVYSSWPVVVEAAAKNKMMADATNIVLDNGEIVSDVLAVKEVEPVLRILFDLDPDPMTSAMFSDSALVDKNNQVSEEQANRILDWARRLGIVCKEESGYRLDTAYAKGIKAIFEQ